MYFTVQQKVKVYHLSSILVSLCDPQFSPELDLHPTRYWSIRFQPQSSERENCSLVTGWERVNMKTHWVLLSGYPTSSQEGGDEFIKDTIVSRLAFVFMGVQEPRKLFSFLWPTPPFRACCFLQHGLFSLYLLPFRRRAADIQSVPLAVLLAILTSFLLKDANPFQVCITVRTKDGWLKTSIHIKEIKKAAWS